MYVYVCLYRSLGASWSSLVKQPQLHSIPQIHITYIHIHLLTLESLSLSHTHTYTLTLVCMHIYIHMLTAAVLDDVMSLVLLAVVQSLAGTTNPSSFSSSSDSFPTNSSSTNPLSTAAVTTFNTWSVLSPILISTGAILIGIFLTWLLRPLASHLGAKIPTKPESQELFFGVLTLSIFGLAGLLAYLCALVGSSELLGCFFAGLVGSAVPGLAGYWQNHSGSLLTWGTRLFFACTVAFGVPPLTEGDGLFSGGAIWLGFWLANVALWGKLVVGLVVRLSLFSHLSSLISHLSLIASLSLSLSLFCSLSYKYS